MYISEFAINTDFLYLKKKKKKTKYWKENVPKYKKYVAADFK